MPTKADFVAKAQTWLGVPAIASGAQRHGVSCLGLPIAVLRELGGFSALVTEAEKHVGLKHPEKSGDLLRKLSNSNHLRNVIPVEFTVGNIVLFFTQDGPQHIAIVSETGIILHAMQSKKKVIDQRFPPGWRVAAEFEIVGLTDG